MEPRFIYITCRDEAEAAVIGKTLVEMRLAACANILPPVTSFYRWNGKLAEDREVVLIAKTLENRVENLVETVKTLHSYEVPCIVALPILQGNEAYIRWIKEEVNPYE
ncbi:MAG: divalent-cation tolerance protein CutA [Bacteroidia bacterium]